jgi:dephospho-CoA kinase
MVTTRGYTRDEAEARIAAQMPLSEKAAKSHYVIANNGSVDDLHKAVAQFAEWLGSQSHC